jgi:uncharacterized protein (TIGR00299 family) protein
VILYVDCVAGVAGDMLLAALLDAGADEQAVREGLGRLGVDGLDLRVTRAERHGISGARIEVLAPHEHVHRTWGDVRALIDSAALPAGAAARAHDAFRRLAVAEARVHATEPELVHFHEVGAVDAIADICGACLALETLGVDDVVCSPLPVGRGFVRAAHGRLPLPAPATLEILRDAGAPLEPLELRAELVTPTGAALVAALASRFGPFPALTPRAIGYGAGTRDLEEVPNVVRVVLGEPVAGAAAGDVLLVETNLDDLSPELVPDAAAAATAAGALDVWTTAAQMKKGRPGVVLSALARPADAEAVAGALLRHTSALGVRLAPYARRELDRDWVTVDAGGAVRVKRGWLDGELVNVAPEHDDCAAVARSTGRPVKEVWARALTAAGALGHDHHPEGHGHGHDHR